MNTMTKEEIKTLRKRLGMTQQELAVKLGTGVITVSRWERGVAVPSRLAARALERLANRVAPEV